jgi:hypothetical protein
MDQKHIRVEGVQDTLDVYDDKVTITPRGVLGFINKGLKGTKTIPHHSVVAIQFKKAGGFTNGYIQFTISGGKESTGGLFAAVKDENTFMFGSKHNDEMEKVKQFIEGRTQALRNPTTQVTPVSIADELTKLTHLKSTGAITEAEYLELKSQLIKRSA